MKKMTWQIQTQDTDDPDAEAAVAKDEPGEKIFTDDYDDLA